MKNLPLQQCDAPAIKLIMLTTDGAPVMLGCNSGVQVLLKEHREALAVSHAYKSVQYFLRAIYSHFSHSSVRIEKLKMLFKVLDKKFVRLQKLFDIRCLCRLQAVKAVVSSYSSLVLYFDDLSNSDVTAEGLSRQLRSYRFFVLLHFLYDLLTTLGQLNKTFHITTYHPSAAYRKVHEVIKALKSRYIQSEIRWGPFAMKCIQQIENGEIVIDEGHVVRVDVKKVTSDDAVKLVQAVFDNLQARFPDNELIEASKIFDPQSIPALDVTCATYGEKELDVLTNHYSKFVYASLCSLEWNTLKECMVSSYKEYSLNKFVLALVTDKSLYLQYLSLSILAEIIIVYPATTSEVERGFSYQNSIKTKFRNRLGSVHLDQLIRLRLNAPSADNLPFASAYQNWMDSRHRRSVIRQPLTEKFDIEDSDED